MTEQEARADERKSIVDYLRAFQSVQESLLFREIVKTIERGEHRKGNE